MNKGAQIQRLNPRALYNKELSRIRATFRLETMAEEKKLAERKHKLAGIEESKNRAQDEDIKQFKLERKKVFDQVDRRVGMLEKKTESGTVNSEWLSQKQEQLEQRNRNYKHTQKRQREERLDRLVHLYHHSEEFITYLNLNERVLLAVTEIDRLPQSIPTMLEKQAADLEASYDGSYLSPRQMELKEILKGTYKGLAGSDAISNSYTMKDIKGDKDEMKTYQGIMREQSVSEELEIGEAGQKLESLVNSEMMDHKE